MKSISYFSPLFVLALILLSCKKDSGKEDLNQKDMLTAHNWKLISRTKNAAEQTLNECDQGDCWIYLINGDLNVQHGNLTCYPNGPNIVYYCPWTLSDDGKTLTITVGTNASSREISFSGNKLIMTFQISFMSNIDTYIDTYIPCE